MTPDPLFVIPAGVQTRWASPENCGAAKGAACASDDGRKRSAWFRLPAGESRDLLDLKGIWRPEFAGKHEVSFGFHADEYHLNNPTYLTSNWTAGEQTAFLTASIAQGTTRTQALWLQDAWRFHPDFKMEDVPPTPRSTMDLALREGKAHGLDYVYVGNIVTERGDNTYCPNCGSLLVRRTGFSAEIMDIKERACSKCGRVADIIW